MARLPRIVVPDTPHHVTQRGNRRQPIFFCDDDYALCRDLLAERCRHNQVSVWAYCLMPNHVHLILTPGTTHGLSRAVGEAHRRYTAYINARDRVTGHLFQSRFNSVAMDEVHFLAAVRYVVMNPVKAGFVPTAADWRWSSAQAHLTNENDGLVDPQPVRERVPDFAAFVKEQPPAKLIEDLQSDQSIGRPLMPGDKLKDLERTLNRRLRPLPRGPRPRKVRSKGG